MESEEPAQAVSAPGPITIREYRPGDEAGILACFERVFGQRRSLEHWRWKFERNPAGRHISLAVAADGAVVGQFAGLPVEATRPGGRLLLSQGVDHMVDPDLHGRGVFKQVARHYFEHFCPESGDTTYFGVNQANILEIDERTFAARLLRPLDRLWFDLERSDDWAEPSLRRTSLRYRIARVARFDPAVDDLWERCARDLGIAAVRDSRALNWRYADCPDVDYVLLEARHRFSGRVDGIAVVRAGWLDEPLGVLADWLVPRDLPGLQRRLLLACHRECRARGARGMAGWLLPGSPEESLLHSVGYVSVPTPFFLSTAYGHGPVSFQELQSSWYFMNGDTDIF